MGMIGAETYAYDFEVNKIQYTIISFDDLTVSVVGLNESVSKIVEIPSNVEYKNKIFSVTSIGRAFYEKDNIEKVIIQNGVNIIETAAFYKCTSLKEIVLPNSLNIIKDYAFYNCRSLKEINIPDNVTSLWENVFQNCTSLRSAYISKKIGVLPEYTFQDCINLTSINWNYTQEESYNEDYQNVTGVIYMEAFRGCSSLKTLIIPSGVGYVRGGFSGCASLDSLIIEDGDYQLSIEIAASPIEDTIKNIYLGRYYRYKYDYDGYYPPFTQVKHLVVGNKVYNVPYFFGKLETLTLGTSIMKIGDLSKQLSLQYIKLHCNNPPEAVEFSKNT